ncbi:MAG: hypothetical protein IJO54_03745 [Oscillospiraceae bacterium]|nr:hypothetical protein [Oscillospiraceae bacterium]
MNRMHNRKIRRYAVAFVLLILSGYLSVFIKDTIDSRNPDVSLPAISVTTGYSPIPSVPRAGYEWNYRTKSVMSPYVSSFDVPLIAYDALLDTPIIVEFSVPHKQITLYESKGVLINGRVVSSEEFEEKRYSNNTPNEKGIYVYKVVAQFEQGTIVHYFALDVSTKRSSI